MVRDGVFNDHGSLIDSATRFNLHGTIHADASTQP